MYGIYTTLEKIRKAGVVMNDHMYTATMEFVTERINYHGANESKGLLDAVDDFEAAVDHLKETLTEEQRGLFLDCETFFGSMDGEQMRFYYEAGFADAIRCIMGWREGWSGQ
jgi:hypothetical protein